MGCFVCSASAVLVAIDRDGATYFCRRHDALAESYRLAQNSGIRIALVIADVKEPQP